MCDALPAPAWGGGGGHGAAAALVSGGTAVPPSHRKMNFPRLLGVAGHAAQLFPFLVAVSLSPPSSTPTQWVGTEPTHPRVEDSLLKRRPRTYTRMDRPAYSFGLYASYHLVFGPCVPAAFLGGGTLCPNCICGRQPAPTTVLKRSNRPLVLQGTLCCSLSFVCPPKNKRPPIPPSFFF